MTTDGEARRRDAQRAFCEAEYSDLVRYCHRLGGDEQLARDVAQEAFVRLFGRWISVREPRAYLYMVATNYLRRTMRRRGTSGTRWRWRTRGPSWSPSRRSSGCATW